MGICETDCFPTVEDIQPAKPDSCDADDCFSAAEDQGKSALGWLWCASMSLCLLVTHAVAYASYILDSGSEQDDDSDDVEDPHICWIIIYAVIFVVALPLLICFALLALAYLLIGCCLSCYNKANKVQPDGNIQFNETSVGLQAVDIHHM